MLLKWGQAEVVKQAMSREGEQFAALLEGPEAKEALAAFLERRKPDFCRF
jgi:enoyl-CoA hydratase/carnithine racemase